ncbi:MAG: DUF853 family protein [Planctomycetales bacterium]|nr:DUF853 family protein [Planctomycetales bacterium]
MAASLLLGRGGSGEVRLKPETLLRHVACLGSSGSGKTVACKVIVEEAVRLGIPVIAVDPQGDIASFACPPDPEGARAKGVPEEVIREFRERVETVIWTPGSTRGVPVSLDPLRAPPAGGRPEEVIRERSLLAGSLAGLVGFDMGNDEGRAAAALVDLALESFHVENSSPRGMGELAQALEEPDGSLKARFGSVATGGQPAEVARRLRVLDVGASKLLFGMGAPLSVDTLLGKAGGLPGRTRISVVYLNSLPGQEEKEFFVSVLAEEIYRWMLAHPSRELQALFYIDEIAPFLPPVKKPACKDILKLLFKQARKYGIGCLAATQNPGDMDYMALSQFSTWNLGRLLTKQDVKKVEGVVKSLAPTDADEVVGKLPSLSAGEFLLLSPDEFERPVPYQVRWLVSAHKTLDEEAVEQVTKPEMRAKAMAGGLEGRLTSRGTEMMSDTERLLGAMKGAKAARRPRELAQDAGLPEKKISGILKALVAEKRVRTANDKSGLLAWHADYALRPDLGLTTLVSVARLEVLEARARSLAEDEAQRSFFGLRANEALGKLVLRHHPIWQVHIRGRVARGWLGRRLEEAVATIYLDTVSEEIWGYERKRGFFTVPTTEENPVEFQDLDDACDFEERGPGEMDLNAKVFEEMMDGERAAVVTKRKFDVEVLRTALVFLPYWVGELKSRGGEKRLVRVDGVVGKPLTIPAKK